MTDVQQESPVSAALKAWKADTERIDAEAEKAEARYYGRVAQCDDMLAAMDRLEAGQ